MNRFILTLLAVIGVLSVAIEDAHAFDPNQKPQRWAYDQGLINQEYLNLRDGLIGHWPFWDQAGLPKDISPYRNHATSAISAVPAYINNEFSTGILLDDAVNQAVTVPDSPSMDGLSNSLTITAWVRLDADEDMFLIEKTNGNLVGFRLFRLGFANDELRFRTPEHATPNLDSSIPLNVNQLYFIACTWDGAVKRIYIDGAEDVNSAQSGAITIDSVDFGIGLDPALNNESWSGEMYEVRLYDRALTAAEVEFLFQHPFADLWPAEQFKTSAPEEAAAAPAAGQVIIIGWPAPEWLGGVLKWLRLV